MPNIKGIELSDGIKIIPGEITWDQQIAAAPEKNPHYSMESLLEYYATHTIEECEVAATKFLNNLIEEHGCWCDVHIEDGDPPKPNVIVANLDVEIPDNWWE